MTTMAPGTTCSVLFEDGMVTVGERPMPAPDGHDVVVAVTSAGLNGADILQRSGRYPAPGNAPDDQPGLEFAGRVVALGTAVTRWAVGDAVMGIVQGAGQAGHVATHEDLCIPVPAGMDLADAGGVPEALVTAHDALVRQAGLLAGDRLLVTGAAGGVGTMAVQLAHGIGATVVASVRGRARHDALRALGADEVISPDQQADAGPWDVVLELVGAPSLATVTPALAIGARVVVIGVGAGARLELPLLHLMTARATLRGSTLRARPLADRIVASRRAGVLLEHLHGRGELVVPVASRHDLEDAADAYTAFETSGGVGKVLVVP